MTKEDKIFLLDLARKKIAQKLGINWTGYKNIQISAPGKDVKEVKGTFVTLSIDGNLRGCIGQIIPDEAIIETIGQNAQSAAFHDPRFPQLDSKEFESVEVEISILSKPERLTYSNADELLDKIKKDIQGLIIRSGGHSATFLPQVWDDIETEEEFLSHLCMKASLPAEEWRKGKLEVYTYTVEHFDEKELGLNL